MHLIEFIFHFIIYSLVRQLFYVFSSEILHCIQKPIYWQFSVTAFKIFLSKKGSSAQFHFG